MIPHDALDLEAWGDPNTIELERELARPRLTLVALPKPIKSRARPRTSNNVPEPWQLRRKAYLKGKL